MHYMGGKQRISKDICKFLNSQLRPDQPFVDLFCGSCNVTCGINPDRQILANDYNEYLVTMWRMLRHGWVPPKSITEEDYQHFKNLVATNDIERAMKSFVGFGCSFSGK